MNRLWTVNLRRFRRRTALLLALICLGISGGMTLGHTDDIGPLLQFHAGQSSVLHFLGDDSPSPCPACQWEDSTFDPHLPAVPVLRPALALMPLPFETIQTRTPPSFDHTSPRAPPCAIS